MTTYNVALLDRAIEQIERHPETWDQGSWRCETGMCVAGWIVTLAGDRFATDADTLTAGIALVPVDADCPEVLNLSYWELPTPPTGYKYATTAMRACELLGIPTADGDIEEDVIPALFHWRNDLVDIKGYRDELASGIYATAADAEFERLHARVTQDA